jgi:GNAT superfamily N-acetyltransferase
VIETMLPKAPPPFRLRAATLDDAQAVADLRNTCAIEQTGRPQVDPGELRSEWQAPRFCPETDAVVVLSPRGTTVGQSTVRDQEPHVHLFATADVHPLYRGLGIGTTLSRWAEDRGQQAAHQAPPGARVLLAQSALSTDTATIALLRARGYEAVHHEFWMVIDLERPPPRAVVPDGIVIRPFIRGSEELAVVRAIHLAFQGHYGYVERPLEDELADWAHYFDTAPPGTESLWFVAADGQEIAATCLCHPYLAEDPDMAYIFALGVRPVWRRRGVALALLLHSFCEIYRYGRRRVALSVDAESPTGATRLYEKAGMHIERQSTFFEKELRPAG